MSKLHPMSFIQLLSCGRAYPQQSDTSYYNASLTSGTKTLPRRSSAFTDGRYLIAERN